MSRRRSSRGKLPQQSSPVDPDAMMRDIDQEEENGSASITDQQSVSTASSSSSSVVNRKRKFSPPPTETSSQQQQVVSDFDRAAAASSEVAVGSSSSSSSSWFKRTRNAILENLGRTMVRFTPFVKLYTDYVKHRQLAASPFLRCLYRDIDSVSVVMQFPSLNGVRDLYSTCRMWKDFISSHPWHTSFPTNSTITIMNKNLQKLWETEWLGSQLTRLILLSDYDLRQCGFDDFELMYEPLGLSNLPRFTRLIDLHVESEETIVAPQDIEFISQLPSLQLLFLSFPMEAITQSALELLSQLSNLRKLHVNCRQLDHSEAEKKRDRRLANKLRFKCLQNLARLEDFSFTPCIPHFCTKKQMLDIVQMKQLKTFMCGNLLPTQWDRHDPKFDGGRNYAQFIEETYGVLPQMPSLEVLNLENVSMESQILAHVTKCASLRRLSVNNCNLTCQDEWIWLKHLHNLRELKFKGEPKSHLDSIPASVLSGLAQCPLLEKVEFSRVELSEMMLTQLVNQIPNLQTLGLSDCSVPSLKPLANAPALKRLELCHDANFPNRYPQLPSLPYLTSLKIVGSMTLKGPKDISAEARAKQISSFKAELASRMPNLSVDAIDDTYLHWFTR